MSVGWLVGRWVGCSVCWLTGLSYSLIRQGSYTSMQIPKPILSFIEMSYCELGNGCFISCVLVWNAPKEAGNCFQVVELLLLVAFGAHFILYFTV